MDCIKTLDKAASSEIIKDMHKLDLTNITSWLSGRNLIDNDEILLYYKDVCPWKRNGGETYSTVFEYVTNKQKKTIILKALVTISPEKSLLDWKNRRDILAKSGVPVSNWYYQHNGTIIEDFYPNSASAATSFEKLIRIGFILDKLGFTSLKFLDDVRVDSKGEPFYVDFGFDLGEPSETIKTSAKDYLLRIYPGKAAEINNLYQ